MPAMTIKLAAAWFGVSRRTAQGWVTRYQIQPVGHMGNALIYPMDQMAEAERRARQSPGLRRPRFAGHTPT